MVGAPVAVAQAPSRMPAAAIELEGLTVDSILFKWRETLQTHVDRFRTSTQKVQVGSLCFVLYQGFFMNRRYEIRRINH
jgi:hypothetical protein